MGVAPLSPTGQLWEVSSDLSKGFSAVNAIECIFKVEFEKPFCGAS